VLTAKLDAFAFELFTFLSMGQSLGKGENVRPLKSSNSTSHASAANA
jgi:biopolymer transport protein ExbB